MQKRVIKVAQSFQQVFEKEFRKQWIDIHMLIKKLNTIPLIGLRSPFVKIKCYLWGFPVRGIALCKPKKNVFLIVPLFIVKKTDKQRWDNIILSKKVLQKIDNLLHLYQSEFEQGKYKEYE